MTMMYWTVEQLQGR